MRSPSLSKLTVMFLVSLACTGASVRTIAQNGHPLVGTWSGYWGADSDQRTRVLLLLEYDGDQITGIINPGPAPARLTRASLNPETWTVVLEGDRQEADGSIVRYVIEGRIENLTSPTQRAIAGSWMEGNSRGEFRVTLN